MKTIINKLAVLLLAAFAVAACSKETEYKDTGFSEVQALLYPSGGDRIELIEHAAANTYFEWQVSKIGTPVYTVVFMNAEKVEVGRYLADNNGKKSSLKMLHSALNAIAGDAGIEPNAEGDLYWTVCAGLGGAEKLSSDEPHKLTLKRYSSIDAPVALYVTGDGSEFTADPAAAQKMRKLSDNEFEIYTKLNGSFSFINRNAEGNKRTFGASDDGRLTEGAEAAGSANGVYRVTVNFKNGTVALQKITDVALLRAGMNYNEASPLAALQYKSNGTWTTQGFTVPTGGDDRYRFRAVVDGNYQIWGSASGTDAQDPGNLNADTNPYFNIHIHTNPAGLGSPTEYARVWKFHAPLKSLAADVIVNMSPDVESYYHSFDLGFDPVATPVTLIAPVADTEFTLSALPGSEEAFSWVKLTGTTPDVALTTYSVVFFADAALTTEAGRKAANNADAINISHADLEAIANSAGIAAEGQGVVYWAVESNLLNNKALSNARKLTLNRLQGIPTEVYITGVASEYGSSGYKALKSLGAGKFEIFTKLTPGNYTITDKNTGAGRNFVVTGTAIAEGAGDNTSTETAIYRITFDFVAATAKYEKITGTPYMQIAAWKDKKYNLNYSGDGIWETGEISPDFTRESAWNGDTRFFIKMVIDGTEYKLSKVKDFGGDDPTTTKPEGTDDRYYISFWNDASDWDYHYKVDKSYRGQNVKKLDLKVNLGSAVINPYIYFTYNL